MRPMTGMVVGPAGDRGAARALLGVRFCQVQMVRCFSDLALPHSVGAWSLGSAAWQQPQLSAPVMETAAAAGDGHL